MLVSNEVEWEWCDIINSLSALDVNKKLFFFGVSAITGPEKKPLKVLFGVKMLCKKIDNFVNMEAREREKKAPLT